MSERDTLYLNILGEVGACLYATTETLITQCQSGLITVNECMNELDGAQGFATKFKLNMSKYDERDKI